MDAIVHSRVEGWRSGRSLRRVTDLLRTPNSLHTRCHQSGWSRYGDDFKVARKRYGAITRLPEVLGAVFGRPTV